MIQSLKTKLQAQNEIHQKPFPLWALLYLYETAPFESVYCNYMEGFKALVQWLSPIESNCEKNAEKIRIPRFALSYELQEISKILHIPIQEVYLTWIHLNENIENI